MDNNLLVGKSLYKEYEFGKSVKVFAVNGIDIDIKRGEFLSLLGRSGSGKTTLLQLLSGIVSPTRGQVFYDKKELSVMREKERALFRNQNIGFVFQSFYVEKKFSAFDNVLFPLLITNTSKIERKERVENVMEMVGLSDRMMHKPIEMSGGELQRLCIARALVNDPDIIFADEPTGQLDSQTALQIMKLFEKLNEYGKTMVMVTHNEVDAMQYSSRIIRINDGKVVDEVVL